MKYLIPIIAISLLSACAKDPLSVMVYDFKVTKGVKCPEPAEPIDACQPSDPNPVAEIVLDTNGAPVAVNQIDSCAGKKVTWKYATDFPTGTRAPQFLIVFEPDIYPGNGNSYKVLSSNKNATNQEFTLNTRILRNTDGECLNYSIMIPGKGFLDPMFIIKR